MPFLQEKVRQDSRIERHTPGDGPHAAHEEAPRGEDSTGESVSPQVFMVTHACHSVAAAGMPTDAPSRGGAQPFSHLFSHPSLVTPLVSGNGVTKRAQSLPSRMVKSSRRETPDTDQLASTQQCSLAGTGA